MKRIVLEICFTVNVLFCLVLVPLLITVLFGNDSMYSFLTSEKGVNLRMYINLPILILWVNNIIVWYKKDKKIIQLVMILIFNALYNPFYYRKAVKNKWV
jgi:hypothetical protein